MDINQLNCFITVAQTLNFSEAARRNYLSQSTVSRYISDLEKEFDVQLFTRSHRDVIITNEGKTLLPYAIEIVETLKKAKTVIKQMHDGGQGKITLGCDVTSLSFPSKCISDFSEKYPGISVEVKQIDSADKNQAITGSDFDFCFMPRDMVPENSNIESIVTHLESLVIVTARKSKFNGKKSISLRELSGETILLLSETVSPIIYMEIMDLFRTFHISPKVEHTYEDIVSMYVSVSSGLGVSIIPQTLAQFTSSEYTEIFPIEETDTNIAYVMAWGKNSSNPASKLFVEAVKKFAKGDDNVYGL